MNKDCTEFEILISAAIDGELDPGEFAELELHVDHCNACRRQYQAFETVNDWLIAHDAEPTKQLVETSARTTFESVLPVNGHAHATSGLATTPKATPRNHGIDPGRGRTFLAGGMLAAAAAGLAALLSSGTDEPSTQLTPLADIVVPVEKVSLLNERSHSIQDSQARMIEQELRTLKLLARHSSGQKAEIQLIEQKIDALKQRLDKLNETSL